MRFPFEHSISYSGIYDKQNNDRKLQWPEPVEPADATVLDQKNISFSFKFHLIFHRAGTYFVIWK